MARIDMENKDDRHFEPVLPSGCGLAD